MSIFAFILMSTLCNGFYVGKLYTQYCDRSCKTQSGWDMHTVCERASAKCRPGIACGGTNGPYMTDELRQAILDKHNELRNKIALGEEERGSQPAAANMNALNYNFELEFIAQCLSNTCVFKHDKCRRGMTLSVGQNLATFSKTVESGIYDVDISLKNVQSWYNEVDKFNIGEIDSFAGGAQTTGHYTQMVWADIEYIGCGRTVWYSNGWYKSYLVCNYGGNKTGGNLLGAPIYRKGDACSGCADSQPCNDKYKGLCGKDIPVTEVDRGAYGRSSTLQFLPIFRTTIKNKNVCVFLVSILWYLFMKILL